LGRTDQANHIYDLKVFWAASKKGNVPAVSYLRASAYQDGHPGYSTPILEQEFLVKTINRLQKLPQWKDMAIVIAFDDSGGWYDHEMAPIVNQSQIPEDALFDFAHFNHRKLLLNPKNGEVVYKSKR
jgi:phospholipase C